MCGIIGYFGRENATPVLLDGLKRLEYRGYDSAGIAVHTSDGVAIRRTEGKLVHLENLLQGEPVSGTIGIGHTRWATHGRPSETNAHPHCAGDIVLVHNGIIENYDELKRFLQGEGQEFTSETDTEVICHLIDYYHQREGLTTTQAIRRATARLSGSYALVIMDTREPDRLYVAKNGSPLVVGANEEGAFVASDIPALLPYTREMIFLEDGDYAMLSADGVSMADAEGEKVTRAAQHIPWNPVMAERGGYKHFMLKEIYEQPLTMRDALAGRIDRDQGRVDLEDCAPLYEGDKPRFDRIVIIACGTSYHAGMVGKYLIESLARVPVTVDLASEFRYRNPLIDDRTLVIPISQSGETADTLAAQRQASTLGALTLAICNVVGSSIPRASDATLYTHAGPEIGVASTKAFTTQLVVLNLFALDLATRLGRIEPNVLHDRLDELVRLSRLVQEFLDNADVVKSTIEPIAEARSVLFIGRGANFPVALEGALKLKEISYIHAEGFAAGELKHGPIALIDHGTPVVALAPRGPTQAKVLSNIEEVRARGAFVIALGSADDEALRSKADIVIPLPDVGWEAMPMIASVPLQLMAYYVADYKGTDVDQPRNLAKSVTVE